VGGASGHLAHLERAFCIPQLSQDRKGRGCGSSERCDTLTNHRQGMTPPRAAPSRAQPVLNSPKTLTTPQPVDYIVKSTQIPAASVFKIMATLTDNQPDNPASPWYSAYPAVKGDVKGLSRDAVLELLHTEGAGTAFVLVDVRRADHEVGCPVHLRVETDTGSGRDHPRLHQPPGPEPLPYHTDVVCLVQGGWREKGHLVLW